MKMSDFHIPKSRVLVTGACGSVGSALVEAYPARPPRLRF